MPIQTPQQFYDWFAQVDRSVAHSQEAHFRAHVAMVAEHLGTADMLLERLDEVEGEVDSMFGEWRGVEEGGRSLKDACERLLEDRVSCRTSSRYLFTDVATGLRTSCLTSRTRLILDWSTSRSSSMQLGCLITLENHLFSKLTSCTWSNVSTYASNI